MQSEAVVDEGAVGQGRRLMSHERLELVATIVMSIAVVLTA